VHQKCGIEMIKSCR